MTCRNVTVALVLSGLLAGCNTYYAARRDLGIDPSDPPVRPPAAMMPAQAMPANGMPVGNGETPPPGTVLQTREGVAQANWAAQRAASLTAQDNTLPVGYQPEQQASAGPLPVSPVTKAVPGAAPKAGTAMVPPVQAPAHASPPAMAAKPAAAPTMPPPPAGLPAGYHPSPSAIDQTAANHVAAGQMPGGQPAAHAPPAPATAPPAAMAMKDAEAMHHDVWRAHLASYRSEEEAIAGWESLLKTEPKLGRFDPQVLWTDIPNRGSYARLTMGEFADRKAAEAACETVRTPRRYCAPLKE